MTKLACRNLGAALLIAALVLPATAVRAQSPDPSCGFQAQDKVRLGNGSEFGGDLGANSDGGRVLLGRHVTGADGTAIEATSVRVGNASSVDDVDADNLLLGRGASIRGDQGEVDLPLADPFCEIPAIDCGGENVSLAKGDPSKTIAPGSYGAVALDNGTTLRLDAGEYTFCSLKAGRNVTILVTGASQSTIDVAGNFEIGNGSVLRSADGTPSAILNVGGARVRVGAGGEAQACLSAPGAHVSLGRGVEFTGAVCSETLATSRNVQLICADDCVVAPPTTTTTTAVTTTTSTSSTTSTTTTTTTTVQGPFCGDGVKNQASEECDTLDFGGATCDGSAEQVFLLVGSPTGSLLCTDECIIDRSNCDGTTSTTVATTTTTIASTTSTTVASTTTTIPPTTTTVPSTTTTIATTTTSTTVAPSTTSSTVAPSTTTSSTVATTTTSTTVASSTTIPPSTTSTSTSTSTTSSSSTSSTSTSTSTSSTSTSTSTSSTSTSTSSTSTSTSTTSTTTSTTSTSTTTTVPPNPTAVDLTITTGGGVCGDVRDGTNALIKNLSCGGLNIGGGSGNTVQEGLTPSGTTNRFAITGCVGDNCTLGGSAAGVAGPTRDCSSTNCFFGTPLPIPNGGQTTCVINRFSANASGTLNIATGEITNLSIALGSTIRVTGIGNVAQPCPICTVVGTPSPTNPLTGTCNKGVNVGATCTTTNPQGLSKDCQSGPGDGSVDAGTIAVNLTPLSTGTRTSTNATGAFCPSQTTVGCFGSSTCRTITEIGSPAGTLLPIGTVKPIKLASTFCIPATTSALVNFAGRLPGPGALSLVGDMKLIP